MPTKRSKGAFAPQQYVLDDLDRAILAALPDEGAKIGKYLDATLPVVRLRAVLDGSISMGLYAARLRLMHGEGLVVGPVGRGKQKGWQRTAKGKLAAAANN